MWRQGDVLIEKVEGIPDPAKKCDHLILAEGELTGHRHQISDPGAATLFASGNVFYLRVNADTATVVHQEHKPIVLERGIYRVWRQREYTPERIRDVLD